MAPSKGVEQDCRRLGPVLLVLQRAVGLPVGEELDERCDKHFVGREGTGLVGRSVEDPGVVGGQTGKQR